MDKTLESLYKQLQDNATNPDWATRGILADFFEDSGEQFKSDAIRWMIVSKKRPYYSTEPKHFHWFNDGRVTTESDPESNVPEAIFTHMKGKEGLTGVFRDYENFIDAEEDFYQAYREAMKQDGEIKATIKKE